MKINKSKYIFEYDNQTVALYNSKGARYFTFPTSALLKYNDTEYFFDAAEPVTKDNTVTYISRVVSAEISEMRLSFTLNDSDIEVSLEADNTVDIAVQSAEYFRRGKKGLYMVDCINYFNPQPRNLNGVNRGFYRNFPDASSDDGYFTPPPLHFSIGNRSGFVCFGLLDLPNSLKFNLTPDLGILAELPAGHVVTKKGAGYKAPRLMLTFHDEEWESITLYRNKLLEKGIIKADDADITTFPSWWKNPFIVTYGDQMMELQYNWYDDTDWGCDAFTDEWLDMWLERAEKKLGFDEFTIIVDAFWQHKYSSEGISDKKRFPNFRKFIDKCHAHGHKVMLWQAPFIDNIGNGFETLAQKYGVLSDERCISSIIEENTVYHIDFTADNIADYLAAVAHQLFGNGDGELDCDGLKLDFLMNIKNPEKATPYKNPDNGIGVKEVYRFYEIFNREAKKVKADVLLNGSTCDPRIQKICHMNRLHDIQKVYEERELRARVSTMACPDMLVDSDGAIMLTNWVPSTYASAVIYSTPSLYYINKFHDGIGLPDEDMAALSRLLQLCGKKQYGVPQFVSADNWLLKDKNTSRVIGAAIDGHTTMVISEDNTGYIFTWQNGEITVPLYGNEVTSIPEGFRVENGALVGTAGRGNVVEFKVK